MEWRIQITGYLTIAFEKIMLGIHVFLMSAHTYICLLMLVCPLKIITVSTLFLRQYIWNRALDDNYSSIHSFTVMNSPSTWRPRDPGWMTLPSQWTEITMRLDASQHAMHKLWPRELFAVLKIIWMPWGSKFTFTHWILRGNGLFCHCWWTKMYVMWQLL